ncbi:hypothetical protein [Paenibacillus solani]|uniref:Uncharacterized protein n=2 Tax=Paenibacillus TaxID=44249 RepID=A0A0M1P7F0_9BACL|nr:hypothetical protein [Paenibacillus solani]KOR90391.1 hypothetical protein AM231_15505 [Paenibacillus solani]
MCFKLLDLNYKSKFVIDELEPILVKILGFDSVEDFIIRDLLIRLMQTNDDDEFINICRSIYHEYCNGYNFFRLMALKYIVYDYDFQLHDPVAKADFLLNNRAEFIEEGKRLLRFFDSGALKIFDIKQYIDLRTKNEKIEEDYWK